MKLRLGLVIALLASMTSLAAAQLTPMEELGKALFFDKIASPDRQSCATCHGPLVGFTGPNPGINLHGAVYRGAVPQRFGNRKPPSASYATLSPIFHYDEEEELFVGGNFWDGRATGEKLGNPAADQALGPFLNPVEQNNPNKEAVLGQVAEADYAALWEEVWGEPVSYETPEEIEENYNRIGLAIAAYEGSSEVNQFSSKFDLYLNGEIELTAQEQWGMELFESAAMCAACHPAPLFTDFTYDNLGVPKNPENPFYDMDEVFLDNGEPINPEGDDWIDPGLGGFLATLPEQYFDDLGLDKETTVSENYGKHKVPTLRNVGSRPGPVFPKAYMHNGALKTLKEVVHFYNTRDVEDWPDPEVYENMNTDELGDLGLTDAEEDAIVAFMNTLTDGYQPPIPEPTMPPISDGGIGRPQLRVVGHHPFNLAMHLGYNLPRDGVVRLSVYSVAGRRLSTLVNEWKPEGDHQVDWAASHLPSGQYFVRLEAGGTSVDRKVTLIR